VGSGFSRIRYGVCVITSVPFDAGGSHQSTPEYATVSVSVAALDAVPVSVAEHAGVASPSPPVGKDIIIARVVPSIVPENVPVLLR
jgi:hypothetical protein